MILQEEPATSATLQQTCAYPLPVPFKTHLAPSPSHPDSLPRSVSISIDPTELLTLNLNSLLYDRSILPTLWIVITCRGGQGMEGFTLR
jgi:hypothetical protein